MDPGVVLAIVVIVALVVAAGIFLYSRRQRSEHLRERFGPEYEHAVQETGDRSAAERALREREAQVEKLDIRSLSPQESERFGGEWREAQARFVDDPVAAIKEADRLVQEVMRARGYPMGDFDARAALISVDHPHVVSNYRAAHEVAQRNGRGETNTEDLRQAMVHYRALFEELLETQAVPRAHADGHADGQTVGTQVPPAQPAEDAKRAGSGEHEKRSERKAA